MHMYVYILEFFQNFWSMFIRKVLNDVESERLDNYLTDHKFF